MKQFDHLFVYGDSYATPDFCVKPSDSFWGLTAKDLGVTYTHNSALPGTSFDLIEHSIVGDIDNIPKESLLLIGLPILERFATFRNYVDNVVYGPETTYATGGVVFDSELNILHEKKLGIVEDVISMSYFDHPSKGFILHSHRAWIELSALRTVLMLGNLIKAKGLECIFVNLDMAYETNDYNFSKGIINEVKKMPNQIIFDKTLHSINEGVIKPVDYDQYGWQGHHGAEGNKNFYDNSLRPTMIELGLL